ncbi:MAG TPA: DUF2939 domain-containing protein [Rhizomicrobium sp.]|jgi:hypothetical protein|nr:DUF2939 domain-containing protein [Rhizomicrobium sp.]
MRRIVVALAIAAALFAVGYLASPYYAFYKLEQAAKAHDRDALEDDVDFPALRDDFKAQINAALLAKTGTDPHNPLVQLGLLIVPAILDRLIDSYVTPDGVATMLTDARAPMPGNRRDPEPHGHVRFDQGYDGLGRFKVTATEDRHPDKPLTFVLARRGLFGWKLVRIELPLQQVTSD